MNDTQEHPVADEQLEVDPSPPELLPRGTVRHMPAIRAPEKVSSIYRITMCAALLPLIGGLFIFGWRAGLVAGVSMLSCLLFEKIYFRVMRTPSLLGRSHALLTGLLLALTLPPFTPVYVVVIAAAFAIVIGKAIFGGVGHFLWQPALVGRFAVAVIMPLLYPPPGDASLQPERWPVLDKNHLLAGDIRKTESIPDYRGWRHHEPVEGANGFMLRHPADIIAGLSRGDRAQFSSLSGVRRDIKKRRPPLMRSMPPIRDLIIGTRPGGIGETSTLLIILAAVYLVYRKYVKWQLPISFIIAAAIVAAVAPVQFAGHQEHVTWHRVPLLLEGFDVGFTYVCYQLLSGQILLAACLLATEMTSRPVTTGGQVIFGVGCGIMAMLFKLYMPTPIPAYFAVLCMNTFTPTIDILWQPRVFGQKRFGWSSLTKT